MADKNNRSASFTMIERLIFSLWIVPNPLGFIIINFPRSKKRNLMGILLCGAMGILSICFAMLPETSSIFTKVAISALVGTLVALVLFALVRRVRRMK